MIDNSFKLTPTDFAAIASKDANYLLEKGATFYNGGQYHLAIEYYLLAASMGNDIALSNLGYCYLYGRSIPINVSLAVAYFKLAVEKRNCDAAYKLGNIYSSDKWDLKDTELSTYYYSLAASFIMGDDWFLTDSILWCSELQEYPSLCYALGIQMSQNGNMGTNSDRSYQFLKHAELGYQKELENGHMFYENSLQGVQKLLANSFYDSVRELYDHQFDEYKLNR